MTATLAFRNTRRITKANLPAIKAQVDSLMNLGQNKSSAEVASLVNNEHGTFYTPRQIDAIWLTGSPFERV